MGKKNKKARAKTGAEEAGISRQMKREMLELINQLLEKCSVPVGPAGPEWGDFLTVFDTVEKIRRIQQGMVIRHYNRDNHRAGFIEWLKNNGVDTSAISIAKFPDAGHGLRAERPIEAGELFLQVPRQVMMTVETAKTSCLEPLVTQDRILQSMPNVVLALHLLCERCTPESFWAPYIKILPTKYTTPLYFNPEEMQHLKGSPTQAEVLNQYRNIARQYAYFYKMFHSIPEASKLPIKDFCFDDYRWAVSTVMTRQNQIPAPSSGQTMVTALIPMWDMCNHADGQITTDFSLERDACQCFALRPFKKYQQIYIFYGPRSNGELLVHNGFVYPRNQCDRLSIKLGVSKNDNLFAMKSEVLARLSMLPSRIFHLHAGDQPVDSDLIAYLRVFNMDEESLKVRLMGEKASELVAQLRDFSEFVSVEVETKAWMFLETRAALLLRAYPTTREQDEAMLKDKTIPDHIRLSLQLLVCEKKILERTIVFSATQRQVVEKLPDLRQMALDEDEEDLDAAIAGISLNPQFSRTTHPLQAEPRSPTYVQKVVIPEPQKPGPTIVELDESGEPVTEMEVESPPKLAGVQKKATVPHADKSQVVNSGMGQGEPIQVEVTKEDMPPKQADQNVKVDDLGTIIAKEGEKTGTEKVPVQPVETPKVENQQKLPSEDVTKEIKQSEVDIQQASSANAQNQSLNAKQEASKDKRETNKKPVVSGEPIAVGTPVVKPVTQAVTVTPNLNVAAGQSISASQNAAKMISTDAVIDNVQTVAPKSVAVVQPQGEQKGESLSSAQGSSKPLEEPHGAKKSNQLPEQQISTPVGNVPPAELSLKSETLPTNQSLSKGQQGVKMSGQLSGQQNSAPVPVGQPSSSGQISGPETSKKPQQLSGIVAPGKIPVLGQSSSISNQMKTSHSDEKSLGPLGILATQNPVSTAQVQPAVNLSKGPTENVTSLPALKSQGHPGIQPTPTVKPVNVQQPASISGYSDSSQAVSPRPVVRPQGPPGIQAKQAVSPVNVQSLSSPLRGPVPSQTSVTQPAVQSQGPPGILAKPTVSPVNVQPPVNLSRGPVPGQTVVPKPMEKPVGPPGIPAKQTVSLANDQPRVNQGAPHPSQTVIPKPAGIPVGPPGIPAKQIVAPIQPPANQGGPVPSQKMTPQPAVRPQGPPVIQAKQTVSPANVQPVAKLSGGPVSNQNVAAQAAVKPQSAPGMQTKQTVTPINIQPPANFPRGPVLSQAAVKPQQPVSVRAGASGPVPVPGKQTAVRLPSQGPSVRGPAPVLPASSQVKAAMAGPTNMAPNAKVVLGSVGSQAQSQVTAPAAQTKPAPQ